MKCPTGSGQMRTLFEVACDISERLTCIFLRDASGRLLRGNQDEKTYCLTGECSRDVECCLTERAPVASLILRPSGWPLFWFH